MSLSCMLIDSPVGTLKAAASSTGLVAILWQHDRPRRVVLGELLEQQDHPILLQAQSELTEYFAGRRQVFTVPLDLRGTPFQAQVWKALLSIPFGETRSYGQIARQLGHPAATRAVGAANGRNPISIIVPCHRLVGSSGQLTGFAGGLEAKTYLLKLERSRHALCPS